MDDEMIKAEIKTYVLGMKLSVRARNVLLRRIYSDSIDNHACFGSLSTFIAHARATGLKGEIYQLGPPRRPTRMGSDPTGLPGGLGDRLIRRGGRAAAMAIAG